MLTPNEEGFQDEVGEDYYKSPAPVFLAYFLILLAIACYFYFRHGSTSKQKAAVADTVIVSAEAARQHTSEVVCGLVERFDSSPYNSIWSRGRKVPTSIAVVGFRNPNTASGKPRVGRLVTYAEPFPYTLVKHKYYKLTLVRGEGSVTSVPVGVEEVSACDKSSAAKLLPKRPSLLRVVGIR